MMTMGVYVVVLISLDSVNLHGDQLGMLGIASGLSENLYGGQRLMNRKRARKADRDQAHGVNVLYWHLSEKENDLYLEVKALSIVYHCCSSRLCRDLERLGNPSRQASLFLFSLLLSSLFRSPLRRLSLSFSLSSLPPPRRYRVVVVVAADWWWWSDLAALLFPCSRYVQISSPLSLVSRSGSRSRLRVTAMEAWLFCKLVGIAFGLGCDNLRCVILELHLGRLVQRLVRDGVVFCDIILGMDLLSRHRVLLDCLRARVHISGA
ncbi:hypothetical protein F2Q69_00020538 [Brassica cretica]|uniref:Uncharacterized protein n=1 Tax=Brassica cretica TaxID=69181 RepID=A0A8S9QTZ5_BRACR|nr:hypothetical protein F2Q69_00020538 [Brassica cretica]